MLMYNDFIFKMITSIVQNHIAILSYYFHVLPHYIDIEVTQLINSNNKTDVL